MTPGTLAIIGVLCLVAAAIWAIPNPKDSLPQVGDVYAFSSEGTSSDPTVPQNPWSAIEEVLEINGDNMKTQISYIHAGGKSLVGQPSWGVRRAQYGREKLRSGPAKPQLETEASK